MIAGFNTLLSEEEIHKRLDSLVLEIEAAYPSSQEPLVVLGVLTGAFIFASDLVRRMQRSVQIDFIQLSSYGSGQESSGNVKWLKQPSLSLSGRDILVLEDIVDTGHTVKELRKWGQSLNARHFKIASLLDKPSRRQVEAVADFVGFTIEDHFVVGYGLDLDGRYRELKNIVFKEV